MTAADTPRGPCIHCGGGPNDWPHRSDSRREGFHAYEPPEEFDHGAIMPSGLVRPVQMQPADAGGWLIKPVPGQVVGDFTEEAEARRAAASWNATRRLKVENIEVIPEVLQFVHDFATLTSSRKLREAYTAAGMSPDVPLALLKQAKALAGRLPK